MRQFGETILRGRMRWLTAILGVALGLAGGSEAQAQPAKTLTWIELVPRSDVVALVKLTASPAKQTEMDGAGGRAFVRHQRPMTVMAVLAGRGLAVGQAILVDDPDWRGDLAHHRRCQVLRRQDAVAQCPPMADKDALASQLSREPRPGQVVIVALQKRSGDWQLAAERAMDAADQRPLVEQVLRKSRGGRR